MAKMRKDPRKTDKGREAPSDRSDVATWGPGSIQIIRRGSGGPLISEAEMERILSKKED
jgi:hypothetical protein